MSIVSDRRSTTDPSLAAQLADAPTVLLLAPAFDAGGDEACTALTTARPDADHVLCVPIARSVDDRFATWEACGADLAPAAIGAVGVGDLADSAHGCAARYDTEVSVATVPNVGDLTGLGVALSNLLTRWAEAGARPVVCIDSLTTLLQYAERDSVFRFLHALGHQFTATGATAHLHLDPTAHDEATVNTLLSIVDAVVRVEDGDWTVTTRSS